MRDEALGQAYLPSLRLPSCPAALVKKKTVFFTTFCVFKDATKCVIFGGNLHDEGREKKDAKDVNDVK